MCIRDSLIGLGGKGDAGTGGNVVEDDGQLHPVGDVLIVPDKAGLGALVIVRGDMEQGVGTGVLRVLGEVDGGGSIVAARASDCLLYTSRHRSQRSGRAEGG